MTQKIAQGARLITAFVCVAAAGVAPVTGQETLRSYALDQERSSLVVVVHRAGLLSFLGHEHAIVPEEWRADLCLAEPVPRSAHGNVVIQSRSLLIDTDSARALAGLGGGPGEDDLAELQENMLDAEHLDALSYPEIVIRVDSVATESAGELVGFGGFTLRGITREISVPLRLEVPNDGTTRLSGTLRIQQRDFGIEPESKAGLVKVSNDVDLHFLLVATPTDLPCTSADSSGARAGSGEVPLDYVMDMTTAEQPVVRRAVAAYHEAKKGHTGQFRGRTADQILEELSPSPVRWAELAAFVIATAEGPIRVDR